jgi:hypothetical protein
MRTFMKSWCRIGEAGVKKSESGPAVGGCRTLWLALAAGSIVLAAGCATPRGAGTSPRETLMEQWGIEITAVRLSAHGNLVDFRYKVLDSEKASELSGPASKPYLVDQASGARLLVPRTPKIGPLRQTAQTPEAGRVYFLLFANPGKLVKAGNAVTVVVGDFRAEDLRVQ